MNHTTSIFDLRKVNKIRDKRHSVEDDPVVREAPLTIMLNNEEFATLVCSPGFEKELVIGFLAGEGIIRQPGDIKDCFFRGGQGVFWIETHNTENLAEGFLCRNFTSCCGKGRPSLYYANDASQVAPVAGKAVFSVGQVTELVRQFEAASENFRMTGGVHAAALSSGEGLIARYEDIGRHNALDRIMGYAFLNSIDASDMAVLLSGRVSSEMLIKTARIGAPIVVSRSAPTGLALDLADQLGITVVGFARGASFNVYTHEGRISDPDGHSPGAGSV